MNTSLETLYECLLAYMLAFGWILYLIGVLHKNEYGKIEFGR